MVDPSDPSGAGPLSGDSTLAALGSYANTLAEWGSSTTSSKKVKKKKSKKKRTKKPSRV